MEISVVVPVYNTEKYLSLCLDSLVKQDFQGAYEIILVNDGSADGSLAIAKDYAAKYTNIRLLSQRNQGPSAARNAALKIASGKYVTFVDSDDLLADGGLETLYNAAETHQADVVLGCCKVFFEKDILLRNEAGISHDEMLLPERDCNKALTAERFYQVYVTNTGLFSAPWGKLFRRSVLTENGISFPEGRNSAEDVIITGKIYAAAGTFSFVRERVYLYRRNDNSITGSLFKYFSHEFIDNAFYAAQEIMRLNVAHLPKELAATYKRVFAGSNLILYLGYQLKAVEALLITEKLDGKYILFGASVWVSRYLEMLKGSVQAVYLADNDTNKQGKILYGCPVLSPDDLLKDEYKDIKIFITSSYFMEIYSQLKRTGVIKELSEIMPYEGKNKLERLYMENIMKLEALMKELL